MLYLNFKREFKTLLDGIIKTNFIISDNELISYRLYNDRLYQMNMTINNNLNELLGIVGDIEKFDKKKFKILSKIVLEEPI